MSVRHAAFPWLVMYAADVLNKCQIREQGKTSFELSMGRACIEPIAEFGELVYVKPFKKNKEALREDSWRDRFAEGLCIGSIF